MGPNWPFRLGAGYESTSFTRFTRHPRSYLNEEKVMRLGEELVGDRADVPPKSYAREFCKAG